MYYDTITGLPIQESFLEFASKLWSSAENNRFAMLSLRIGSYQDSLPFYKIPDYNAILTVFTQKVIRGHDYMLSACRNDSDCFWILLDLDLLPLSQLSDRLEADLKLFFRQMLPLSCDITLSVQGGICIASRQLPSIAECTRLAEIARTSIDITAQNKLVSLVFYRESLSRQHQENRILPLFEDVLLHHHLIIYLQPKFMMNHSDPSGAEALVRIMDTKGHLLKPASFLPVLEKYDLVYELDLMVIECILKLLKTWSQSNLTLIPISVNLSSRDFLCEEFLRIFREIMDKYESVKSFLGFEFSAAEYYNHRNYMESVVDRLHQLDCMVSLDGFGGDGLMLSSIDIPSVDMVKFHRNFLQTGFKSTNNLHLFRKIAEMFEACNIPVLCEGVEDEEEEKFIQECGISYAQGFFYGRPVPFDIFQKKYMLQPSAHLALWAN